MYTKTVNFSYPMMTPDLAAKLANISGSFSARLFLCHDAMRMNADSLIGLLALEIYEGEALTLEAEGEDAQAAVEAMALAL